jgi:DNA-binding GntR family transcriptional regulator
MKRDGEFHTLLDEASGNVVLAAHLSLLRRQAVLFWGQTTDSHASLRPIITDFEDTMRALQHRNADACAKILQRHVLAHIERIQLYMKFSTDSMDTKKHR